MQSHAPSVLFASHVVPAPAIPLMRHALRLLFVAATATLVLPVGTQRLPAMGDVFSDTLIVYALSGTDVSYPTALNVQELAVVRATVFRLLDRFDIDATERRALSHGAARRR